MSVLCAYLHPGSVSHSFSDSLMRLVAWDAAHDGHVVSTGGPVMFRCGTGGIVEARNSVAEYFLSTDHEWLWMIDTDMGFAPDTVDRLLDAADPAERPAVGALCFGLRETEPDGLGGFHVRAFPTLYDWAQKPDGTFGFMIRRGYDQDSLTQVAGTGAACLLVHRTALEKVLAESGTWFDKVAFADGTPVGEDLSFCYRLNKAGLPLFIHTGVKTTHHKQFHLGEREYELIEAAHRDA